MQAPDGGECHPSRQLTSRGAVCITTGQRLAPGVRNVTEVPFKSPDSHIGCESLDFNDESAGVDKVIGLQLVWFRSMGRLLLVNMWPDLEARTEKDGIQWELISVVADA